ncbi:MULTISPECIES: penicillin-binding protein activator [unclassified Streptomyces]|uniref:caspase, EACC1-associated type n=1 Tax=unclassified Streptomyces TaxID=2593676 RepID=UPI002366588E|nr:MULTISPECIES: penicillin-binding protein activator [unclassified Streptomyces]MDF3145660.1 ABC transporter substrate-binding protein [Streptomyces sp. T21Q-yed]WDF38271.1 ABC transporter substrate-binding protein [Streptomyces sp. T12]
MSELSEPALSRALLIGAHSFADPGLEPLPAVSRNLTRLAELLRDPSVWGLASDRVRVLPEPDRDQALEEVARLADEAEDTLLVYYAGHGFVHELSNELYLALPSTNPRRLYSALRYQDIRELLLAPQTRARRKVVILDCCWSGLALHGAMSSSGLGGMSDISGTFVLTATSETRTALAPPGETYTAFTGELIDALEQGIPQAPPLLTMMTLYQHLYGSLVAKGRPTPQQRNGNTAGAIALARNRYRSPEPMPVPEVPPEGTSTKDEPTEDEPTRDEPAADAPADSAAAAGRRRRRLSRRTVVVVSTVLVAALGTLPLMLDSVFEEGAKGGSSDGGGSGNSRNAADTKNNLTVGIGVSVPLSGDLAELGKGIKNSAELAVEKANEDAFVPGVTFKIQALDDKAQPATGGVNATKLVGDPDVVGVVGPLNASIAKPMQEVFVQAHLPQISPANSAPELTLGADWLGGTRSRPYDTYFRTVANDMAQAPAAAEYLYGKDGRRKAFVIDNKLGYGQSMVEMFKAAFRKEGGTIVGQSHVDYEQRDFTDEAERARASGADVVYFGGEYPSAAPLSKQLHAADPDIRVAGGDGLLDNSYASQAGSGAAGDICTFGGAVTERLKSAKSFVADYEKAGYSAPYGPYGGYAYDATWALIRAFKEGVHISGDELPSTAREDLRDAVQEVEFGGVMGRVGFDGYGDAVSQRAEVYQVRDGAWKPV